jgi:hypothetical protein
MFKRMSLHAVFLESFLPEEEGAPQEAKETRPSTKIHRTRILDMVASFVFSIPNALQNLVSGKAGVSDLRSTKQAMCKHLADGVDCKDEDAGAARNQVLKCVRYNEL